MNLSIATAFLTFVPLCHISAWDFYGQTIEGIFTNENSGTSTAISKDGTRIVIGSPLAQVNYADEGLARVYEIDSAGSWSQVGSDIVGGSIVNDEYPDTNIRLGTSVDISSDGKYIILGFPGYPYYPFEIVGRAGIWEDRDGVWTPVFFPASPNINGYNLLGWSVAMCDTGEVVVVGAPKSNGGTGSAHVYKRQVGGWSSTIIYGDDLNGRFGSAVNISGDCSRVIVNGRKLIYSNGIGNFYSNSVIYKLTTTPLDPSVEIIGEIIETWIDFNDDDKFMTTTSNDLSHDGNRAIIGNGYRNYANVYDFDSSDSTWNKVGADMVGWQVQDNFGYSVGICGDGSRLIVGSPTYGLFATNCEQGRSQVFEYNSSMGFWQSVADFERLSCGRAGNSVGITGDCTRVVTGYPKHVLNGNPMMEVGFVRAFISNDFIYPSMSPSISPVTSPVNCVDAFFPIAYAAFDSSFSCAFISNFGSLCLCDDPDVSSHCPHTCNSCGEYNCADSTATFYVPSGAAATCAIIGNLDPSLVETYCQLDVLYNMCRGTCGVCD